MITRNIFFLILLLASQTTLAISDGIFRTMTPDLILEAQIWTEVSSAGTQQFMSVRQIEPVIKEVPPQYVLLPQKLEAGVWINFEKGDLRLPEDRNRHVHGHQFFVTYTVPVSKRSVIELSTSDKKVIVLERTFETDNSN